MTTVHCLELSRWSGLLALEHETLARRQPVVSAGLLLATLIGLAFLTGMVLCLAGSVFLLARLQGSASTLSGEGHDIKVALSTASPGIARHHAWCSAADSCA